LLREGSHDRLLKEQEYDLAEHIDVLSDLQRPSSLSERQRKILLAADHYYSKYPIKTEDSEMAKKITAFLAKARESQASKSTPPNQ
jgi:hypothetical protein